MFGTLVACGGSLQTASEGSPKDSGFNVGSAPAIDAEAPDAFGPTPIDANGAPIVLPLSCQGAAAQLSIRLPCAVGFDPLNATECYLSDATGANSPAFIFLVSLRELARRLNEPQPVPSDVFSFTPTWIDVDGSRLKLAAIEGTVVFSQVDPVARAFVGKLLQMKAHWLDDTGRQMDCAVADAPIWAVPGNFL